MSKIFGYSNRSGKDWFVSDVYSDNEIEKVKDPEGGVEISLLTAIPSPFARIDLVKTAFKNIVKSQTLKAYSDKTGGVIASKDDEKLVSECLDLAEILFNIDSLNVNINIIIWNKELEINKLKDPSGKEDVVAKKHKQLAEAFELYFQQDNKSYNFDLLDSLYLIKYDHKIIGCTSPSTLFFSTANDLKESKITLPKNNKTFGDKYTPLYERDYNFQKYIYLLFYCNRIFSKRMKLLADYLDTNLKILRNTNKELFDELNAFQSTNPVVHFKSNYNELGTGIPGSVVEIFGISLRKQKKEHITSSVRSSDFIINSIKYLGNNKPLVLQENFNKRFKYVNDDWDGIKVPFIDYESNLEKRLLPGIQIKYPYLTISDFLEPYLIRLVYPINDDNFFDGNLNRDTGDSLKGYILPIKKLFFDYYNSDDLLDSSHDNANKPIISLIQGVANTVKVILRIPISRKDEYISFERIYYPKEDRKALTSQEEYNKGVIVERQFGVTIFPFIKTNVNDIPAYYRVQLIDRDVIGFSDSVDYELKFYSNTSNIPIEIEKQVRSRKILGAGETATTEYYVLKKEFDYIQIVSSDVSGIIIPKWNPYNSGNLAFSFAVDFGTTNTHIEYKIDNISSVKPFSIDSHDVQIATLFHPIKTSEDFAGTGAIAIRELIDYEFVPKNIGDKYEYNFPQRTVIALNNFINTNNSLFTLADFNIPFIYEKKHIKDAFYTDLKWGKKNDINQKCVESLFEEIVMLIRNKVLLNKGDIKKTRLIWFYPTSMPDGRKSELEAKWREVFYRYFIYNSNGSIENSQIIKIPESFPPFFYFKNVNNLPGGAASKAISIDIGGGTTDVVVFKSNRPILQSSFRFAANTMFGDGFNISGNANSNSLINKYIFQFEKLLEENKFYDLLQVMMTLKEKNSSTDLNAFFFSFDSNSKIKDKILFSYNKILSSDEDLKILFLYFYSAIIYYIAQLLKNRLDNELPKHLIFSGTGSKILTIITKDKKILEKFSLILFESVFGSKYGKDGLSIESENRFPKEVTCKGSLMLNSSELSDMRKIDAELLEISDCNRSVYNSLDSDVINRLISDVENFNEFFISLSDKYNYINYFNVSKRSVSIFKTEVNKNLNDYLMNGLEYLKEMDGDFDEKEVNEDTMFFLPIIGSITNLINKLLSNKDAQQ